MNGWEVRTTLHIYTQTPCGFLEVGTAFSSCLGDPIMRRLLPGLAAPVRYSQREERNKTWTARSDKETEIQGRCRKIDKQEFISWKWTDRYKVRKKQKTQSVNNYTNSIN